MLPAAYRFVYIQSFRLLRLRFGVYDLDAKDLRFVFSYQLIPDGETLEIEEAKRDPEAMKQVLKSLWDRIWGN